MEQLRLDDLRTGDRIRITTTNSTYEILVVASEAQLGEICGGHIDFPTTRHTHGQSRARPHFVCARCLARGTLSSVRS